MGCSSSSPNNGNDVADPSKEFTSFDAIGKQSSSSDTKSSDTKSSRYSTTNASSSSSSASSASCTALATIHRDIVFALCAGPGSSYFTACEDRASSLSQFDYTSSSARVLQSVPRAHDKCITDLLYAPSSNLLYTASRDRNIKCWSVTDSVLNPSSPPPRTLAGHTLPITSISLSPDEKLLVSGSRDYSVRLWDVAAGTTTTRFDVQQNVITDLCFIPSTSGNLILQSSEDLSLRVWDVRSRSCVAEYDDGPNFALHCDASSCGNYLLTAHNGFESKGCELKVRDRRMAAGTANAKGSGIVVNVQAATQSMTGMRVLSRDEGDDSLIVGTSSKDGSIRVFDIHALMSEGDDVCRSSTIPSSSSIVAHVDMPLSESVQSIASGRTISKGRYQFATGHVNGRVTVWEVDTKNRRLDKMMEAKGAAVE